MLPLLFWTVLLISSASTATAATIGADAAIPFTITLKQSPTGVAILKHQLLTALANPGSRGYPLLYKMAADDATTFRDVTSGNSTCTEYECCGANFGYVATDGYDVVSGLGTPDVKRIVVWLDTNT